MSIRETFTFWLFFAFLLASTWTKKIQKGQGIPGKKNDCKVRKKRKSIWEMELFQLLLKTIRNTGIAQSTTTATTATGLDRKSEKNEHIFIQVYQVLHIFFARSCYSHLKRDGETRKVRGYGRQSCGFF